MSKKSLENSELQEEVEEIQLLLGGILEELRRIESGLFELAKNHPFVQEITTSQDGS